ncbi:MAG: hypothetical protein KDK02_05025 [Rhodobacteraceae bacterium]|nr:hypothetical protein [Paracoccaceae bacterium]
MNNLSNLAFLPLVALLAGALAGLVVGRFFGLARLLWLLGAVAAVSLVVVIWLATVGPGEEEGAFLPFALLVGALFPALFGAIMGGLGGRALAARAQDE